MSLAAARVLRQGTRQGTMRHFSQTSSGASSSGGSSVRARNGVLGGAIFTFVGGVYYYTVHMLRRQENEMLAELEKIAAEED